MVRLNPLQQLRDLDTTSLQFHKQLSSCLRGSEYQSAIPNLQGEDLAWLVEYLDGVSLQTISTRSALDTGIGSRQYFRSCRRRVPGIFTRTQRDM